MTLPLEGYRVLDWTVWQQGPVATALLGDLGAEVIKIEQRGVGDPGRGVAKITGAVTGVQGRNWYFENNNRNKRSLAVDLNKQEGKQIIYRLVEKSDAFVQNLRQGVAVRLGLDYDTLVGYNPRLVYASASGWGPEGPDTERPSYDLTGLARSGLMTQIGEPNTPPLNIYTGIGDQMGATMTALGVITALLVRERTGMGQKVDTSLYGSLIWLQGVSVAMQLILGTGPPRTDRTKAGNPLFNHYLCKDGKWLVLSHLQADRHWPAVCRALGIEHLEKDPKFENMEVRGKNARELIAVMDQIFASKSREEWLKTLGEAEDLCFEPIQTLAEMVSDPQASANDYITDFDHPVWGAVKAVGYPMKFSKTPAVVQGPAPEFGQHTEEILTEVLGYSWDDIARLQDSHVI